MGKLAPEVIADYTLKMLNRRAPRRPRDHVPLGRAVRDGVHAQPERDELDPQPLALVLLLRARPTELGPQDLAGPRGEQEGRPGRPHGRAKANSAAQLGKYDASGESAEAAQGMYEKGYTY